MKHQIMMEEVREAVTDMKAARLRGWMDLGCSVRSRVV